MPATYGYVQHASFPDDPVARFIGHSPNGQVIPSLLEMGTMFASPASAYSCYGTAAVGCDTKNVEISFSYGNINPADLQQTRQAEVNRHLQSGSVVPNTLLLNVNREREQMDALRRQVGAAPLPAPATGHMPSDKASGYAPTDSRVLSVEQLKQQLQGQVQP